MVCNPASNNINIPDPGPGPSIPGLGLPFSVPKTPFPDIQIPQGIPEDLNDLIERIFALFPASIKFSPNTDGLTKDVWDVLASLFNQLAPFLGFYKFIQALMNIILCIIDVLCALLNPFALIGAIVRLFKKCLPDFLSLFPWIALVVMILALILLLIALIEYVVEVIIAYVQQIIENIAILTEAIQKADQESILAAVNKLAYLLCMIEQLFSLLLAISAIFAVIRPLMGIGGRGACSSGDECCTEDFCPTFISGSYDGRKNSSGRLIYFSKIVPAFGGSIPSYFSNLNISLREESWQFVDDSPKEDFRFVDIITPSPEYGFTYWPEGETYESTANIVRVPYLMDMNVWIDPASWGNPSDTGGYRQFNLQNVIVSSKPTVYPTSWNGGTEFTDPISGAFRFVGGEVYEYNANDDGYTRYFIGGLPATIETFIHIDPLVANAVPSIDDGYNFLDIEYHLRFNTPVLVDKRLIGLACQEAVAAESAVFNAEFSDLRSVLDKLQDGTGNGVTFTDLPNVDGALECLNAALAKFRSNINVDAAAVFQAEMEACLGSLLKESQDFYVTGTVIAADPYASDFTLDPDMQFVKNDIVLNVILRDRTGTQLAINLDETLGASIAETISANVTFGVVSAFEYDGYGSFNASLYSESAGVGTAKAYINGDVFSEVLNRDNDAIDSQIVERTLSYEFIDKTEFVDSDKKNRYGAADVAEDGR